MADQDRSRGPQPQPDPSIIRSRGPQPDPSITDRMRDPEYVMRGYKAALFDRGPWHPDNPALPPDPRLTARLEDMTDEDRHRARMGLGGPQYDPAAVRSVRASEDRWRRESGGGEKRWDHWRRESDGGEKR